MTITARQLIDQVGADVVRAALPSVPLSVVEALDATTLAGLLTSTTARALEQLRQREVEAPLSLCRLWVAPEAEMDQLRQVTATLTDRCHVAMGGNRSGKTFGAFILDVAVAMGRHHPHTEALCRLNGIDPELIPVGPGEVIVIAPSAGASRLNHRRAIDALLPPGAEWYGRNGLAEAYVTIQIPGYRRLAVIWFKSVDQGAKSFKGTEARRYHIDEEPEGPDGRAVLEECLRGASSVGGKVCITATPQAGRTWMIEELIEKGAYGAKHSRINSIHNRLVQDHAALMAWLADLGPEERAMRERGEWVDRRGAIYPEFSSGVHVVKPFDIPSSWLRFRAVDFGQTNPTAVVWVALNPTNGQLVVYRSMKATNVAYPEWAARIHRAEGAELVEVGPGRRRWRGHTERVELCWGDPSDPEAISTLSVNDVPTMAAHREWAAGVSAVRSALRFIDGMTPGLVFFEDVGGLYGTNALFAEMMGYRVDPNRRDNKPIKKDDHLMDALRYAVRGVEVWLGGGWTPSAVTVRGVDADATETDEGEG